MVNEVGVLHLIERIALNLPLLVKVFLGNIAYETPIEPLYGVILGHKLPCLLIFFELVLDV